MNVIISEVHEKDKEPRLTIEADADTFLKQRLLRWAAVESGIIWKTDAPGHRIFNGCSAVWLSKLRCLESEMDIFTIRLIEIFRRVNATIVIK